METGDVVQFLENHKWKGCLGIIHEVTPIENDVRFTVVIPIPSQGNAFIFVAESEMALEFIGKAVLTLKGTDDNEE